LELRRIILKPTAIAPLPFSEHTLAYSMGCSTFKPGLALINICSTPGGVPTHMPIESMNGEHAA